MNDPEKVELVKDNFNDLLGNVGACNGKVLDMGTGLGRVAIEVAKQFPEAQVIGVDTWTKGWKLFGMTKVGAERNARIEGVSGRCTFQTDSALDLPFEDGEFQLVVSSFAFHEIKVPTEQFSSKKPSESLHPAVCS
ncbi:MAG: class I SAM-dependent methyltransferase [Methanophagales archaeon]|nr:class I SAM-dependent methyltransferase [Methanophagales archaeon]